MARLIAPLLLLLSLLPGAAQAVGMPPERILAQATDEMITALRQEREMVQAEPTHLFDLVDRVLSPHIDFPRMSRWVLGRYWQQATPDQQQRFMASFRLLLVRFYTSALLEDPQRLDNLIARADGLITYLPTDIPADAETVPVRSEVHMPNGQVVPVHFQMHRKDGEWKVFDVSVEGVSVVTNYRSSFASEIQQHGLDRLIEQLDERNRGLLEKVAAHRVAGEMP